MNDTYREAVEHLRNQSTDKSLPVSVSHFRVRRERGVVAT